MQMKVQSKHSQPAQNNYVSQYQQNSNLHSIQIGTCIFLNWYMHEGQD